MDCLLSVFSPLCSLGHWFMIYPRMFFLCCSAPWVMSSAYSCIWTPGPFDSHPGLRLAPLHGSDSAVIIAFMGFSRNGVEAGSFPEGDLFTCFVDVDWMEQRRPKRQTLSSRASGAVPILLRGITGAVRGRLPFPASSTLFFPLTQERPEESGFFPILQIGCLTHPR